MYPWSFDTYNVYVSGCISDDELGSVLSITSGSAGLADLLKKKYSSKRSATVPGLRNVRAIFIGQSRLGIPRWHPNPP